MTGGRSPIIVAAALLLFAVVLVAGGCAKKGTMVTSTPGLKPFRSVAVLPFHVDGGSDNIQTITTCQLKNHSIRCEQVASDIGMRTATSMAREIAIYGRHEVVEPHQVLALIPDVGMVPIPDIGRRLGVEMLMFGTVSRYLERIGGPYGVTRPAAVTFEVELVDARSGEKVWSGRFSHSQKGLSEDLTDVGAFLSGGGKWLTVQELADIGIARLVRQLPGLENERIR
jgi:hypothetical protein